RHVRELCRVYRHKRDILLTTLQREFGAWPEVRWTRPEGGLYVWLTFPADVDTGPDSRLMQTALREGVLYVPGQFCYVNGDGTPIPTSGARLSFGVAHPEHLQEAVCRLARAAHELKARPCLAGLETARSPRRSGAGG